MNLPTNLESDHRPCFVLHRRQSFAGGRSLWRRQLSAGWRIWRWTKLWRKRLKLLQGEAAVKLNLKIEPATIIL